MLGKKKLTLDGQYAVKAVRKRVLKLKKNFGGELETIEE